MLNMRPLANDLFIRTLFSYVLQITYSLSSYFLTLLFVSCNKYADRALWVICTDQNKEVEIKSGADGHTIGVWRSNVSEPLS